VSKEQNNLHPKNIVSAYADQLALINEKVVPEPLKLLPAALPESLLPFPPSTIRHALAIFLLHRDYIGKRDMIEDAYAYLDNFIPEEEYSLYCSLQSSMAKKGRLLSGDEEETRSISNTIRMLKIRTKLIKKRRKHSIQELRSMRRIVGLPDLLAPYGEEDIEKALELEFNV
jgi:hypothetical protein